MKQKNKIMINENELIPYEQSPIPDGPYLVFSPHPDDETLGMGGTIALAAKKGIDINIVFVTDGGQGGDPAIRKKEAQAASDIIGVKNIFYLNLPDREVALIPFPDKTVVKILEQIRPKTVFLPSFQENHPDHRATTNRVLSLIKNSNQFKIISDSKNLQPFIPDTSAEELNFQLWFYEINRQGEINRLIDISDVLEVKESAVECYSSQLQQLDYKVHALCLNFMRSITLNGKTNYAEGFWCHDAQEESITPEQNYFSRFFNYIPQTIDDAAAEELRYLRDKTSNHAAIVKQYRDFSNYLAKDINNKNSEIELLKKQGDEYRSIIQKFEQQISEISSSKSHKIASKYIKSVIKLRDLFKKLRKFRKLKGKNCRYSPPAAFDNLSISNSSKSLGSKFVTSQDLDQTADFNINLYVNITDIEHPIIRLHSKDEIDDIYSDIYEDSVNIDNAVLIPEHNEDNKIVPLFNNKAIGFVVECSKNNLARIDLFMATYMRINPGILILSVYENRGDNYEHIDFNNTNLNNLMLNQEPLRNCRVISPAIMDNSFVSFDLNPIEDSYGKTFYVTLSLTDGVEDFCLGLWTNPTLNVTPAQRYHQWIERIEIPNSKNSNYAIEQHYSEKEKEQLKIGVIIPLFNLTSLSNNSLKMLQENSSLKMVEETINSVLNQSYTNLKIVVIIKDLDSSLGNRLNSYTNDKRVNIRNIATNDNITNFLHENESLYQILNQVIQNLECRYFLLLKPFDTLAPNALYECVTILNQFPDTDLIYSDEDKISNHRDGDEVVGSNSSGDDDSDTTIRFDPFFKTNWSPDLLLSFMYTGDLTLYKKDIFQKAVGYSEELGIDIQYDIILKITEFTNHIVHIPKILYHKRELFLESDQKIKNNMDASFAGMAGGELGITSYNAVKNAIERRGIEAEVYTGLTKNSFRVSYKFDPNICVSIIIPFKDNHEVLHSCIKSILERTEYKNYEIICVNNQSIYRENFLELQTDKFADSSLRSLLNSRFSNIKFTILDYDKPFNYSAINNFAVKRAQGDVLLFLNSDTEVISSGWLNAMLEHACRNDIGAVGAKLYYTNNTIQHAGVVFGIAGVAGHAFKHIGRYQTDYYYGFPCMVRNVSAITGACMMVRRSLFDEVGGFDEEHFPVSYNDLDLCLKISQRGYKIIFTPFAELYHYESYSRGYFCEQDTIKKLKEKWGKMVEEDPFYNPNLTTSKEDWSF